MYFFRFFCFFQVLLDQNLTELDWGWPSFDQWDTTVITTLRMRMFHSAAAYSAILWLGGESMAHVVAERPTHRVYGTPTPPPATHPAGKATHPAGKATHPAGKATHPAEGAAPPAKDSAEYRHVGADSGEQARSSAPLTWHRAVSITLLTRLVLMALVCVRG